MQLQKDIYIGRQTILIATAMVCGTALLIVALLPLFQTAAWMKYGFAYVLLIGLALFNWFRKK
jgi:hypothetical protein